MLFWYVRPYACLPLKSQTESIKNSIGRDNSSERKVDVPAWRERVSLTDQRSGVGESAYSSCEPVRLLRIHTCLAKTNQRQQRDQQQLHHTWLHHKTTATVTLHQKQSAFLFFPLPEVRLPDFQTSDHCPENGRQPKSKGGQRGRGLECPRGVLVKVHGLGWGGWTYRNFS